MWTIENWSLKNDDIFFSFVKHLSQELDSNTTKLLLENQLKYSSRILMLSTWTIVRLRFHSPSDRQWRKEVQRRPFNWNIVVAIYKTRRRKINRMEPRILIKRRSRERERIISWSFSHAHEQKEEETNIIIGSISRKNAFACRQEIIAECLSVICLISICL